MKMLDFSRIDGSFTATTEAAVRDFRQGNGLTDRGCRPHHLGRTARRPGDIDALPGKSGASVSALQTGLKAYAAGNPTVDPGAIDGSFGPRTETAVKAYQSDRGVSVDGIVGDHTWWVPAGAAGATLASLSGVTTA
jgi:peptidoglycan hydrolase-like protein with peptidoglycan-binding domain